MLNHSIRLLIILLTVVTIACDPDKNSNDINGENADAPKISVQGLKPEIEITTQITINITDDSDIVSNTLIINGKEVLTNTDKNFKFDINPFDYPIGENTFLFYSVDEEGNETKFENTLVIKKLLVSIASPYLIESGRVFISANSMSGELLTNIEVFKDFENVKLFANDSFTEQPIIVTSYVMLGADNLIFSKIKSISNIKPGTNLIEFQNNSGDFTEKTYDPSKPNEYFSIEVNGIKSENIAESLRGYLYNGRNSYAQVFTTNITEEPNGFTSKLNGTVSLNANIDNLLLYTSNTSLNSSLDGVKLEDYKFLYINTSNNQSISFSQFLPPDDIGKIYLPKSIESYILLVRGYKDETAFNQRNSSSIYSGFPKNFNTDTIEFPIINDFGVIISDISFSIDSYTTMRVSIIGEKSIEIPNWSAKKNQESILLNGNYDLFKLYTAKTLPTGNKQIIWEYFHKKQNEVNLNIKSFQFPEIIKSLAEASQFELESIKTPDIENITFIGSTGNLKYEELLFGENSLVPRSNNTELVDIYKLSTKLQNN